MYITTYIYIHGVTIRSSTTEAARVAVVQAGAVPYFSHRYIVDELGKNDVAIAKSQDRGDPWHPGHSKWDPAWSFGTLQPDLTEEVWFTRDFDVGNLPRWGYRPISAAMWVRENSHEVAVERIRELAAWEHSHDAERVEWARER